MLHAGDYCHPATPGTDLGQLSVAKQGCGFDFNTVQSLFVTDQSKYSSSGIYAEADVSVAGTPEAQAMLVCRLDPRVLYWFWISADGHWNIDGALTNGGPHHLVSDTDVQAQRQYVHVGDTNHLATECAARTPDEPAQLTFAVNGHLLAAVITPPLPSDFSVKPLTRPTIPWFLDLAVRLPAAGNVHARIENVALYDRAP